MNTGAPPVDPSAPATPNPEPATETTAAENPPTTERNELPLDALRSFDPETPSAEEDVAVDAEPVRLVDPAPVPDHSPAGPVPVEASNLEHTGGAAATKEGPVDSDRQISPWTLAGPAGQRVAFCFNLAKLTGQGEDADPILREARDLGLVAVFDGMGGAGGTTYSTTQGPRTGAYLASRAARDIVDHRMVDLLAAGKDPQGSAIAAELRDSVEHALRARLADLQAPRSILRSRLLRALPTTMAMAAVHRGAPSDDSWACELWWAGDSRIYQLRPGSGLAQLTTDDIKDHGDAMANLRQDSVISNAMSADTAFVVNHRRIQLDTPFLIIAATDGCFGYLPSPMHFEWLLLSTLRSAPDPESWSALLQAQINAVSGDDASLALLGVGSSYQGFQSAFAERTNDVQTRWVQPLDQLDAQVTDLERRLDELRRQQKEHTAQLWAGYRTDYEQYLTAGTQKTGAS